MSNELTVSVTYTDGGTETFGADKTAGLVFMKERYTPFTLLKGTFIAGIQPERIREVRLYRGNALLHRGTGDSAEYTVSRRSPRLSIVSYGYSKQLGQDFAEPGIISQPDLSAIIGGAGITGVTCQQNTDTVNYVYFEDKTTYWNAACIYTMKAYGKYPFIRGANQVLCTPSGQQTFTRAEGSMVSFGRGQQLGNIMSDVYTQDADDQWSYHLGNAFASAHNVTRKKYYPREREWLYDLNVQLKYHMYFSDRGREYIKATFTGYAGEDICDKESISMTGYTGSPEISALTVRVTPKGTFTDMSFYFDSFCNVI